MITRWKRGDVADALRDHLAIPLHQRRNLKTLRVLRALRRRRDPRVAAARGEEKKAVRGNLENATSSRMASAVMVRSAGSFIMGSLQAKLQPPPSSCAHIIEMDIAKMGTLVLSVTASPSPRDARRRTRRDPRESGRSSGACVSEGGWSGKVIADQATTGTT